MRIKEFGKANIEHLDEAQLDQLYKVVRELSESKKPTPSPLDGQGIL